MISVWNASGISTLEPSDFKNSKALSWVFQHMLLVLYAVPEPEMCLFDT